MPRGKSRKTAEPIELFSTSNGICAVDSPVRVKITAMLRERDMPFDEIVGRAGKAKSTVSVHLNSLIQEGVIDARSDEEDRRRKIFFLKSSYLGGLAQEQELDDDMRELFARGLPDAFDFFRIMFRTIRVELYRQGINIEPVLQDAGYRMGREISSSLGSRSLDDMLGRVFRFWSDYRLGTMKCLARRPLTLVVYDCFECSDLPQLGRPACAFDRGLLQALFQARFGGACRVDETECYAAGHDRCCFVIGSADPGRPIPGQRF